MTTHEMPHPAEGPGMNRRWLRWGLGVFFVVAVFFLWEEHQAHLLGALPWLLLLACPLMHSLMHRRHGSRHGEHSPRSGEDQNEDESRKEHEHGGHGC
jgi:hypothetical protein